MLTVTFDIDWEDVRDQVVQHIKADVVPALVVDTETLESRRIHEG